MEATSKDAVVEVEVQQFQDEAMSLTDRAGNFVVTSPESFEMATGMLREIAARKKDVVEFFRPMKDAAHKAHKEICDREKQVLGAFQRADLALRPAWAAYNEAQERKRREAEEAARREVQKRLDEEAKRQAEARRKELEEEAIRRAEETGDESYLEHVPEVKPEAVTAPPVTLEKPKTDGISVRRTPDFEIVNADEIPREYMIPDEKKIRKIVKALGTEARIPGVRVFLRTDTAVRA